MEVFWEKKMEVRKYFRSWHNISMLQDVFSRSTSRVNMQKRLIWGRRKNAAGAAKAPRSGGGVHGGKRPPWLPDDAFLNNQKKFLLLQFHPLVHIVK